MKKTIYYCDKCKKVIDKEKEPYIRAGAKAVLTDFCVENYSDEEKIALEEKYLENHYVRNDENYKQGYDILCKDCGELFIKRVDTLRALLKTF